MKEKNTYLSLGDVSLLVVEDKNGIPFKFLVDTKHLNEISKYQWHLKPASYSGKWYAVSKSFGKTVSLHRLITGFLWKCVDHIDRDTFDNRESNLRESSKSLNRANGIGHYRKIPRGVIPTPKGRFQGRVIKDGTIHHLGTFDTIEEAHNAYKTKHLELFNQHSIFYTENT